MESYDVLILAEYIAFVDPCKDFAEKDFIASIMILDQNPNAHVPDKNNPCTILLSNLKRCSDPIFPDDPSFAKYKDYCEKTCNTC